LNIEPVEKETKVFGSNNQSSLIRWCSL